MSDLNILMLGGKRCGKTTVLSSMCSEIERALAGTNLRMIPDANTVAGLNNARMTIRRKIEEFDQPLLRTTVDENPTGARQVYQFAFQIPNVEPINIYIHDIPGEWLTSNLHAEEVKGLVANSKVIIIAIDTPYLFYKMTESGYGQYHEEYNKPKEIANFFRSSLSPEEIKNRMILFVPLKCERYYHLTYSKKLNPSRRNYMKDVFDAVCTGYRDLIFYLRSTPQLMNSLTMAVTPILSAGGIDFVKFVTDEETGKVVSLYQQPEFLPDSQRGYRPMFCEQPILYAMTYMLRLAMDGEWQIGGMMQGRRNMALMDIGKTYETMRKKLKRSVNSNFVNDGYFIIQNPKGI